MVQLRRPLILASSSPRRQYLMREAGFVFTVKKPDVDEGFPPEMPVDQVAGFLARKKADYFTPGLDNEIIITADTVVILDSTILNKPESKEEALAMLSGLAGRSHRVMTGVCIASRQKEVIFDETTTVTFEPLSKDQIAFYIENFKPFDKAGAYGAQDCLAPGTNPCSDEEMAFLDKIDHRDLVKKTTSHAHSGIVIIRKITGSYFNVMGLPIHKVHDYLTGWE